MSLMFQVFMQQEQLKSKNINLCNVNNTGTQPSLM